MIANNCIVRRSRTQFQSIRNLLALLCKQIFSQYRLNVEFYGKILVLTVLNDINYLVVTVTIGDRGTQHCQTLMSKCEKVSAHQGVELSANGLDFRTAVKVH